MKKLKLAMLLFLTGILCTKAQIGYQVSLLNTATGEPRANETVNVEVKLTNSEGNIIYSGIQAETTNDFGVLSLTIGDGNTFKKVDFSKLPFYIEVSANGVMIGKTQVLSVPVAEAAKQLVPLDENLLIGTWKGTGTRYDVLYTKTFIFKKGGTVEYEFAKGDNTDHSVSFQYKIIGQVIYLFNGSETDGANLIPWKLRTLLYNNGVIHVFLDDQKSEERDPVNSVTKIS